MTKNSVGDNWLGGYKFYETFDAVNYSGESYFPKMIMSSY
jgi:hypothetical protein